MKLTSCFLCISVLLPSALPKECYWGVSGYDGHPLWKKECGHDHCIKIINEMGVRTSNCDVTEYCHKNGCVSNHLGGETCCCDSQLCNSSLCLSLPFSLLLVIFSLLNR